ncbi:transposase [Streptomyces sp. LMG1-1-1.1]
MLEGIVFKFRTGLLWRELPERFGPWQTAAEVRALGRRRYFANSLLAAAQTRAEVDWLVAIDSAIVRAHQHAAAKGGSKNAARDAPAEADRQNPPRPRRTSQAPGLPGHRWQPQRLHPGQRRHHLHPRGRPRARADPAPGDHVAADTGYSEGE